MKKNQIKAEEFSTPNLNKNKPTLQIILTIVGFGLTLIAYVIGRVYYSSYMNAFGISSDFFPAVIQDIYFYASIVVLNGFSYLLGIILKDIFNFILIITCMLFIFLLIAYSSKFEKSLFDRFPKLAKIISSSNMQFFSKVLSKTFLGVYFFTLFIYTLTIFLMFLLYLYIGPVSLGKKDASRKINSYQEHGCYIPEDSNANTCIQILDKDSKEIAKGVLIAYDNDKIAFLNDRGSQIIKFPTDGKIIVDINMTKK